MYEIERGFIMIDFYIRTHSGIQIVTGYKINKSYCCHKDICLARWTITDSKSGFAIQKGLKTGKECFEYVKNLSDDMIKAVEKERKTERYQKACDDLEKWKESNL